MNGFAYIKKFFELSPEESVEETYLEVLEGTKLKGYNFWILGFAMIIACIGLNTDSVSAVIGAMLISPLMGPILGFSFGLAINDKILKRSSIRNWILMTGISLLSSVLFFLVTPFEFNHVQLSAFKTATIFDILLAFFGGMAGFIGLVKKEGTKVIAGVAVATACMPPLCTAGYGIAHGDLEFFAGGLYFYLINCLFIGLSTFILSRFTGFHKRMQVSVENPGIVRWLWITIIIAMTIPGIYLAYRKYMEQTKQTRTISIEERVQQLENKIKELEKTQRP